MKSRRNGAGYLVFNARTPGMLQEEDSKTDGSEAVSPLCRSVPNAAMLFLNPHLIRVYGSHL